MNGLSAYRYRRPGKRDKRTRSRSRTKTHSHERKELLGFRRRGSGEGCEGCVGVEEGRKVRICRCKKVSTTGHVDCVCEEGFLGVGFAFQFTTHSKIKKGK